MRATDERSGVVGRLLGIAVHDKVTIAIAAVSLALLAATQLYVTWLIKVLFEGPILSHGASHVRPLLLRAIVATTVGMVSLFASRYALAAAGQRMVERLREEGMAAILRARVGVVRSAPSGEWLSRLFNDVNVLSGFLAIVVRRIVAETIVLTGAVVLMFVLSWRLALAMAVVVPVVGWVLVRMGNRIRRWGVFSQEAAATLTATISEQLAGFTTVKMYQAESAMLEQVRREAAALRSRAQRAELWAATLISVVFFICAIALMAILVYGTAQVRLGAIEQATFLAFCLYAGQTVEPARRLSEVHGLLQQSIAAATRVYEVIDLAPVEDERIVASRPLRSGAVRFDRVSFAYREGQNVLHDLSLRIDDGEIVGLVGASGCGKSTLARLLIGFEEAHSGIVTVDGADVLSLSRHDLRAAVCVVEQDAFVMSGPLIDNIRLGRRDAPRPAIEEAVAMTGLGDVIASLPRGLESPLREAGRDLSGGQRQRIALARAIVRNPRLLLLDEAMSAIDSESEAATFAAMLPWLRKRTVIVVSHRLATVARLPRVLMIDDGVIAADEHPHRLLEDSPAFRMLFADQIERFRAPGVLA